MQFIGISRDDVTLVPKFNFELFEAFAAQWLVVQFQLLKQEIDRIQSQTESRIKELQHDEE